MFIHFTPTGAAHVREFRYDKLVGVIGRLDLFVPEHQWVNENDEIVIAAAAHGAKVHAHRMPRPDTVARRTRLARSWKANRLAGRPWQRHQRDMGMCPFAHEING